VIRAFARPIQRRLQRR
jgi:hypothetical protein